MTAKVKSKEWGRTLASWCIQIIGTLLAVGLVFLSLNRTNPISAWLSKILAPIPYERTILISLSLWCV